MARKQETPEPDHQMTPYANMDAIFGFSMHPQEPALHRLNARFLGQSNDTNLEGVPGFEFEPTYTSPYTYTYRDHFGGRSGGCVRRDTAKGTVVGDTKLATYAKACIVQYFK